MKKSAGLFQIFLLVCMTFAIAYFFKFDTGISVDVQESNTIKMLRATLLGWLSHGLVSAEEGLWTCLEDKNGSICQEYASAICDSVCNQKCFNGARENYAACTLGTCVDSKQGTCSPNTAKSTCDSLGGNWQEAGVAEIPECKPGCCVMGQQTQFITEQACTTQIQRLGIKDGVFKPVANELACLALANSQEEGACVLGSGDSISCSLTTRGACLNERRGQFHGGQLCSAPDLMTDCKPQAKTGCVEGKDGVYWFDSCGNRENIYNSNKNASWNMGRMLREDESCSLGTVGSLLQNQASCGNCNYLTGSACGTPRPQDAKPTFGDFVCRDLSCTDSDGTKRKQGETWCAFDSAIGATEDKGFAWAEGVNDRSSDVPGSQHYRKVCLDGEIRIEPCAPFRNEICTETRDEQVGFSSAACRINQWQRCVEANNNRDSLAKCEEITDCRLQHTVVSQGKFEFDLCVPRHPPGFDLQAGDGAGGSVAQTSCALATQKCTYVKVKGLFGNKKANQECIQEGFTMAMNNLCASLGDCGAKVNVIGVASEDGYRVSNAPKLSSNYISTLKKDSTPKPGQKASPLSPEEIKAGSGLDEDSSAADALGYIGIGATGVLAAGGLLSAASAAGGVEAAAATFGGYDGAIQYGITKIAGSATGYGPAANSLGAFMNVAGGIAAGAAIGYVIGKLFGFEGDALIALTVVGAVAGGLLASGVFGTTSFGFTIALFSAAFFVWTIVIVVAVALFMKFVLKVGKKTQTTVEFQCMPWQPPRGGADCDKCGINGLPCTKYQCQSLGQTCQYINEGSGNEECVNVPPKDVSAPLISPDYSVLKQGFTYNSISNLGYSLKGPSTDGCLPAHSTAAFGISLNKVGQCKIDSERTSKYEDMQDFFGASNLYKLNHSMSFVVPSLYAIAAADENSTPVTRQDYTLYARCSDVAGNSNVNEYAISFCISPENDATAPVINSFTPDTPAYAAYGSTNMSVSLFTNEPADCRWDETDSAYEVMKNDVECDNEVEDATPFGYPCRTTLPISSDAEKIFFFRCKDQPWLDLKPEAGKQRNTNMQSIPYEVRKTINPLTIVSIKPSEGNIKLGGLPFIFELSVQTSGGAPGSVHTCAFDRGLTGQYIDFFKKEESLGGYHHVQPGLTLLEAKTYEIGIQCRDEAGNTAQGQTKFTLEVDSRGPPITRVYDNGGTLTVITDENAVCSYSAASCTFDFDTGFRFAGEEFKHETPFDKKKTYYVRCRDNLENIGACVSVQGGLL